MIRRITLILSTLLMLAVLVLTIAGVYTRKTIYYYREPITDSSFCVAFEKYDVRLWEWTFTDSPRPTYNFDGSFLGFGLMVRRSATPTNRTLLAHRVTLPAPFLFAVFAILPAIGLVRGPIARWRRHKEGHCQKCGYDLTLNISGVCPECGRPTTASQPPA